MVSVVLRAVQETLDSWGNCETEMTLPKKHYIKVTAEKKQPKNYKLQNFG